MSLDTGYILSVLAGTSIGKELFDSLKERGFVANRQYPHSQVYVINGTAATCVSTSSDSYRTHQARIPDNLRKHVDLEEPRQQIFYKICKNVKALNGKYIDITGKTDEELNKILDDIQHASTKAANTALYRALSLKQDKRNNRDNKSSIIDSNEIRTSLLDIAQVRPDDIYDEVFNIREVDSFVYSEFGIDGYFTKAISRNVSMLEDYQNIPIIQAVYEHSDQTRVAVYACARGAYGGARFGPIISRPGDDIYDYLDVNRLLLIHPGSNPSREREVKVVGVFDNNVTSSYIANMALKSRELVSSYKRKATGQSIPIVNLGDLAKFKDVEKTQKIQIENMRNKVAEKITHSDTLKGGLKVSGLEMTDMSFEYEGVKVTTTSSTKAMYTTSLVALSRNIQRLYDLDAAVQETLNFNTLYNSFVDDISEQVERWAKSEDHYLHSEDSYYLSYSIDSVNIRITKETSDKGASKYLINDIRVNYNEIKACLLRALCYKNQEDFDAFLSIVSKCSLAIHRVIENGIVSKIQVTPEMDLLVKLRFKRENKSNYLVISGDKKIKIRDLRGFAAKFNTYNNQNSYSRIRSFTDFCDIFSDRHFKEELTEEMLLELLSSGKRVYDEALKKSRELLDSAIKATGAVSKSFKHGNAVISGYEVVGMSGNRYFVSDEGSGRSTSSTVYKIDEDDSIRYICIVDRSLGGQVGKDTVVNRLFAMKNDSRVVGKIHTLNGIV